MKKVLYWLLISSLMGCAGSQLSDAGFQPKAEANAIKEVMHSQEQAWSKGDVEAFMKGYWKSDSLTIIGKRGLTYGWQSTLDNYRKSYPDPAAMGKLTFTLLQVKVISTENAYVVGKWHLTRSAGDLEGHFNLLWQKINGRWVIISDHTS